MWLHHADYVWLHSHDRPSKTQLDNEQYTNTINRSISVGHAESLTVEVVILIIIFIITTIIIERNFLFRRNAEGIC